MEWMDVHVHVDHFGNAAKSIQEALQQQVTTLLAQSTHLESQQKTLDLAKQFPSTVKACLGYFPRHVHEDSDEIQRQTLDFLETHLPECIAIGEVGLDFVEGMTQANKDRQLVGFNRLIELSNQYDKPLIVHTRGCRAEMLELLGKKSTAPVLLHSFVGGGPAHVKSIIDHEFMVSVGAGVLDKPFVQSWVKQVPIEHLLLETDGPLDWGDKGIVTSSWIPQIGKQVAFLKGISIEELHACVLDNQQKMGF